MKKNGFTLVELLIYIAIVGLVSVSLVKFVATISQLRNKNATVLEVHENMRAALDIIDTYVHQAATINNGASTFGVDPGVLALTMTSSSINPTIFSLSEDDGKLQITQGSNLPIPIVTDNVKVTNFQLTNIPGRGRPRVRIEMTMEYAGAGTNDFEYSHSMTTTVRVR